MKESIAHCNGPDSIGSVATWVITTLNNYSFQDSTGGAVGYEVEIRPHSKPNQRTRTQNACLHQWCREIAEALNDAGYSITLESELFKQPIEVPFTMDAVKEHMWRPIQRSLTGHESTTEPSKIDYSAIEGVLARYLGESFGITVPVWPSRFNL